LVSPDYYGQCADLKRLAETAHSHGCRLLVDEAHGSHFAFAKDIFPPDAMTSGADMCVQSLHKTLPALTMAAQLHISEGAIGQDRVSVPRVWDMLRLFETSSPSFVIAASSEYALAWMDKFGSSALSERVDDISGFIDRIEPVIGGSCRAYGTPGQSDPLHLVLFPDPDLITAPDLMTALEKWGIHVEFADLLRLVLIISPWNNKKDFDDLFDAVSDCIARISVSESSTSGKRKGNEAQVTDKLWGTLLTSIPQKAISVRSAFFGGHGKASIDISGSEGKICASTIAPYPPGIALIWPGERITQRHIDVLLRLENFGITVRGMNLNTIDVLLE
jgi:arginine/lysine/ornithine decarboxylase